MTNIKAANMKKTKQGNLLLHLPPALPAAPHSPPPARDGTAPTMCTEPSTSNFPMHIAFCARLLKKFHNHFRQKMD